MHCFVDYKITNEEINNLEKLNVEPIIIPKCPILYEAIDGHVDIQLNVINNNTVIVQKDISESFLETLKDKKINYILSKNSLSKNYPNDVILNALILPNFFIHNTKFTDENLINSQKNKTIIDVKQGYTKCSILPLTNNALITTDKGIYNSLDKNIFDILLLPPGDILLPSLDYGFIGGTGGMISSNKLGIFGELKHYKYGDMVYDFLYKYDIEPISLKKGKLNDRGSLLCI